VARAGVGRQPLLPERRLRPASDPGPRPPGRRPGVQGLRRARTGPGPRGRPRRSLRHPLPGARGRDHVERHGPRRDALRERRHRGLRPPPEGRLADVQLRRRLRRRAHGRDPRHPGRRPPLQHPEADPALRGDGASGPRVRPRAHDPGPRREPALEAPRGDGGLRVRGPRHSSRRHGQLPGAPGLEPGRRHRDHGPGRSDRGLLHGPGAEEGLALRHREARVAQRPAHGPDPGVGDGGRGAPPHGGAGGRGRRRPRRPGRRLAREPHRAPEDPAPDAGGAGRAGPGLPGRRRHLRPRGGPEALAEGRGDDDPLPGDPPGAAGRGRVVRGRPGGDPPGRRRRERRGLGQGDPSPPGRRGRRAGEPRDLRHAPPHRRGGHPPEGWPRARPPDPSPGAPGVAFGERPGSVRRRRGGAPEGLPAPPIGPGPAPPETRNPLLDTRNRRTLR